MCVPVHVYMHVAVYVHMLICDLNASVQIYIFMNKHCISITKGEWWKTNGMADITASKSSVEIPPTE